MLTTEKQRQQRGGGQKGARQTRAPPPATCTVPRAVPYGACAAARKPRARRVTACGHACERKQSARAAPHFASPPLRASWLYPCWLPLDMG
eukprot:362824-Chlamydomonas_euryale.AAC.12